MASEIYEDIERLVGSINPKIKDTMKELRILDTEIGLIKRQINIKSKIHFTNYAKKTRYERIQDSFDIEQLHKIVIQRSMDKIEKIKSTKFLLMKYINKINEKIWQFREKMDEDYPNTSKNIEKKVKDQMIYLESILYNMNDTTNKCKSKVVNGDKNKKLSKNKHSNYNYSNVIPNYNSNNNNNNNNNNPLTSTVVLAGNTGGGGILSSLQPPPLTSLKTNRGKNISNINSTKNPNKNPNKLDIKHDNKSYINHHSNNSNSGNRLLHTKSSLASNKNPRKRKATTTTNNSCNINTFLPALSNPIKNESVVTTTTTTTAATTTTTTASNNSITSNISNNVNNNTTNLIDDVNTPHTTTKNSPSNKSNQINNDDYNLNDQELFCVCRQPSYGEMICCDSENCKVGWFHLECVSLQCAPDGEWYCTGCHRDD